MRITLNIITDTKEFYYLRAAWKELLTESKIANPFLTWEWMYAWWKSYGEAGPYRLAIVTAHADEQLIAILPACIKNRSIMGMTVNELGFLGQEYEASDYLDIIQRGHRANSMMTKMVEYICLQEDVDTMRFSNMVEAAKTVRILKDLAAHRGHTANVQRFKTCSSLKITGTLEQYLQKIGKEVRYNLLWYTKKVKTAYGAQFRMIREVKDIQTAIDEISTLLVNEIEDMSIYQEAYSDFHKRVSGLFQQENMLRIFELRIYDQIAASMHCIEFQNELFVYKVTAKPAWEKVNPLFILWGYVVHYVFRKGLKRFDFMRGRVPYLLQWTDDVRHLVSIEFANSYRGKLALKTRRIGSDVLGSMRSFTPNKQSSTTQLS